MTPKRNGCPESSFRPSRQCATSTSPYSTYTYITNWRTTMGSPSQQSEQRSPGSKGPGAAKGRNKASEPHPGTSAGIGPATQPADSSKNTIVCSACGKSGHWSRNCPYYNFCDFCRVTTHSTYMCRAAKHGPGSPVCIYCGKTNHSSAYCRYRPRDN